MKVCANFIEVTNPDTKYEEKAEVKRNGLRSEMINSYDVASSSFSSMQLFESPQKLTLWFKDFIRKTNGSVLIDISCFPKRYFFPLVKWLVENDAVENLIVSYTIPKDYPEPSLAFDSGSKHFLPAFQNVDHPVLEEVGILSVGFLSFDLANLLKGSFPNTKPKNFYLLFPFPPGPPNYQKNWEFVRDIESSGKLQNSKQIIRIATKDVPGCFEHIKNIASGMENRTFFLPFGPKTHSLAICLYSILHGNSVYYTQPKYYHPDYSVGINSKEGFTETYGYCLKLAGNNLYGD
ncbi:MAG: hypothetical protein RRB13_08860 [bacterium]|nr:hypothetical protein [bacterium]